MHLLKYKNCKHAKPHEPGSAGTLNWQATCLSEEWSVRTRDMEGKTARVAVRERGCDRVAMGSSEEAEGSDSVSIQEIFLFSYFLGFLIRSLFFICIRPSD